MIGIRKQDGRARLLHAPAIALVLACALLAARPALTADAPKPVTHTVVMDGVKYTPEALTIKRGDTVVWVNKDPFPHTVTAKGAFDSRDIASGKSWRWTARKTGDYAYTCTLHPNMNGTLKVE
ncbi:MAG TPA: cupredoxin family copper-binding protein [Casimicrobiaceae bacterium]|nr:cupredoxin family copper-binding protein [Casimicrobiaceae bacterium]